MRKHSTLTIIMAAAMALTACQSNAASAVTEGKTETEQVQNSSEGESKAAYKETFHIAISQQPPSLDGHKNSTYITHVMTRGLMYEQLLTLNADYESVPELCESYEMSDDKKTLTFVLRKGVKFHDGSEMTADDVVASMNRWIESWSTAKTAVGEGRFEKVDDDTVKITSENSLLLFPTLMASATQAANITTAAACENEDSNGNMIDYIGTGPYKFKEWKQDQYILFEKFDDYQPYGEEGMADDGWRAYKTAPSKYIEYDYVPETTTREAGLETGQYDFIFNVPSDDKARMEGLDGIKTLAVQNGMTAIVFNKKEGLGADVNFRKAINALVDCDALMTSQRGADGYVANGEYMDEEQTFWKTDAGTENYNTKNTEKAKEYLAESSYEPGTKVRILASTLDHYDYMAVTLQEELKAIDVPSDIITVDWSTFTEYRKDSGMYDLYFTGFSATPLPTQKLFFGATYPGWMTDETMTKYLEDMNNADDMDAAKKVWEKAQAYCWNDYLPVINMGHQITYYSYSDKVEGVNTLNGMHFWNAGVRE